MASTSPLVPGTVESRVRTLATEIFDLSDLGATSLTPALIARSAAFLVLAHAECEYAVERACHRIAGLVRAASDPMTVLLAWGLSGFRQDNNANRASKRRPAVDELVDRYEQAVEGNHGIREHNLKNLLMPLGVDVRAAKLDIAALDTFGGKRGDLAHQPLGNWQTSDLPSAHFAYAVQAAQAADRLVNTIQTAHAQITPARRREYSLRRGLVRVLRAVALWIERL